MNLNKPKPFTPNINQIAKDWQIWKEEFLVYLKLSNGYTQFSEEQRALLLINFMGTEAIRAIDQIPVESNDKRDMDILLIKFDEFFNPSLNEAEERFKFFSRRKYPHEDLDKYILEMRDKAAKCKFGDQTDKFIVDMLILSMNKNLRELIWASEVNTLPEIIFNLKQYALNENRMKETMKQNLNSDNMENVKSDNNEQPRRHFPANFVCSKCGLNHPYKECPAFDEICQKCFMKGHYTSKCKQTSAALDGKSNVRPGPSNGQTKPSTSGVKQNRESRPKIDTLENCLWCNTYHMAGKCPHESTCTTCNHFPHNICFNCKKNPHLPTCYYKDIVTLPSLSSNSNVNTNQAILCTKCEFKHDVNTACYRKYCLSCQVYDHWDTNCPRKNKQSNNRTNRAEATVNNLLDDFVEIGHAFRQQAQPQRQVPINRPRQANSNHNQNAQYSKNSKAKDDSSCCIS